MKKLLGLIVLVAAYVGLTYYSGMVGEQYINQQVALNQTQMASINGSIALKNYQRGVFRSSFDVTMQMDAAQFGAERATISTRAQVYHGPVIFADGVQFGWFYARLENSLSTSEAELNELLASILPQGVGQLQLLGEYGGSYSGTWRTDEISYSDDNGELLIDGLDVNSQGRFDSKDAEGTFTTGAITARIAPNTEITATPMHGDLSVAMIAPQVPLSNWHAQVDNLNVQVDETATVIKNITFAQQQQLVDDKVNTKVSFGAESVVGMMPMTNLYYDMALNQVSVAAMTAWAELAPKLQDEDDFATHKQELLDSLELLLDKDLTLQLGLGGEAMDGYAKATLQLHYVPPADGRSLDSISEPQEFAQLVKGNAQVVVSEELFNGTPLAMFATPYVGSYILQQGSEYVINARINKGQLWVGDNPIDLAPLFASMAAAGQQY
jgi:uncharacterized protein YdgA (DUF945 family)